jgi:S-adenosylmethionine hydrolase
MPIITLTTDFGLSDSYVAQMKGVILSLCPMATIIDITHKVPAQSVMAGALILQTAIDAFPDGTIHVAVVDPGVGTDRRALAVRTDRAFYILPDNGLVSCALEKQNFVKAVALDNPQYHRANVCSTFHGRDIFSSVAGYLASGVIIDKLGSPADSIEMLSLPVPAIEGNHITGEVLLIDHFGNLITNIPVDALDVPYMVYCQGMEKPIPISWTFADVPNGHPVAYIGSTGMLEIALRRDHAASKLNRAAGDAVHLTVIAL